MMKINEIEVKEYCDCVVCRNTEIYRRMVFEEMLKRLCEVYADGSILQKQKGELHNNFTSYFFRYKKVAGYLLNISDIDNTTIEIYEMQDKYIMQDKGFEKGSIEGKTNIYNVEDMNFVPIIEKIEYFRKWYESIESCKQE